MRKTLWSLVQRGDPRRHAKSAVPIACITCANSYLTNTTLCAVNQALSDSSGSTSGSSSPPTAGNAASETVSAQCFYHMESFEL